MSLPCSYTEQDTHVPHPVASTSPGREMSSGAAGLRAHEGLARLIGAIVCIHGAPQANLLVSGMDGGVMVKIFRPVIYNCMHAAGSYIAIIFIAWFWYEGSLLELVHC